MTDSNRGEPHATLVEAASAVCYAGDAMSGVDIFAWIVLLVLAASTS